MFFFGKSKTQLGLEEEARKKQKYDASLEYSLHAPHNGPAIVEYDYENNQVNVITKEGVGSSLKLPSGNIRDNVSVDRNGVIKSYCNGKGDSNTYVTMAAHKETTELDLSNLNGKSYLLKCDGKEEHLFMVSSLNGEAAVTIKDQEKLNAKSYNYVIKSKDADGNIKYQTIDKDGQLVEASESQKQAFGKHGNKRKSALKGNIQDKINPDVLRGLGEELKKSGVQANQDSAVESPVGASSVSKQTAKSR